MSEVEYVEQIEGMAKTIAHWLSTEHPDAKPLFYMPPSGIMVVVDLPSIIDRVAGNADARALTEAVIDGATCGGRDPSNTPTLFMFRVALDYVKCPYVCVPLNVFTNGLGVFTKGGR